MSKKITTVTLDGKQIGKRTSESRTYTHAVLLTAEDAAMTVRAIQADVHEANLRVKALEAAIEAGRVTIRRRFNDSKDVDSKGAPWFHGYEIELKGAPRVYSHSNSKGVVQGGGDYAEDGSYIKDSYDAAKLTPAKAYLLQAARARVQEELKFIEDAKVRVAEIQAGTFPLRPAAVLSWHSSGPLAAKAASAAANHYRSRRAVVVPVDAN